MTSFKMKAPAGASSASVGETAYTVDDGFITDVRSDHVWALKEHGFEIASEVSKPEKVSKKDAK